jgi:hypothetical protein
MLDNEAIYPDPWYCTQKLAGTVANFWNIRCWQLLRQILPGLVRTEAVTQEGLECSERDYNRRGFRECFISRQQPPFRSFKCSVQLRT